MDTTGTELVVYTGTALHASRRQGVLATRPAAHDD